MYNKLIKLNTLHAVIECILMYKELCFIGPKHYANGYRAQYDSDEFREFIKNGGVYGNKAPIHNSNGFHRY